jgi:hypothetical protein
MTLSITINSIMGLIATLSIKTLSMTSLSITTLSITITIIMSLIATFNIKTFNIKTLSITTLNITTLSVIALKAFDKCCYAYVTLVMLSVNMLKIIKFSKIYLLVPSIGWIQTLDQIIFG